MNLKTIGIIIRREYLNKVKKKSFLIITFLGPLFFAAMCILPSIIMLNAKEETKVIAVLDNSGIVMPYLQNTETTKYLDFTGHVSLDSLKSHMSDFEVDAVLSISAMDSLTKAVKAESFSSKPLGLDMSENIDSKINDAVEAYRIEEYGIENLESIMRDVKYRGHMTSYTLDDSGNESISESGVYMAISMLLGMIIYMFIAIFGGMVMSSVIEEKASRVVEVLVSSVKATELMFGKIIGVALVALTQFLFWIVLTLAIVGVAGGVMGKDILNGQDPTQMISGMGVDVNEMGIHPSIDLTALTDTTKVASDSLETASEVTGMGAVLSTLSHLNYGQIIVSFLLFFLFGYLLYASLFAAIGSAVENEGDTQQLQIPLTIPLLVAFFIALYAYKAPDSAVVVWGSMIPFTSPIVMLARIPFGVPMWQLVLSIVLLIATFAGCAWVSAKIYKVGILMYGKKSTYKDLWKWLRMK